MTTQAKDYGFAVGQRVELVECGLRAIVQQVLFSVDGVQFQVSYWDDNVRRVEWVFASEIASVKSPSLIEKT